MTQADMLEKAQKMLADTRAKRGESASLLGRLNQALEHNKSVEQALLEQKQRLLSEIEKQSLEIEELETAHGRLDWSLSEEDNPDIQFTQEEAESYQVTYLYTSLSPDSQLTEVEETSGRLFRRQGSNQVNPYTLKKGYSPAFFLLFNPENTRAICRAEPGSRYKAFIDLVITKIAEAKEPAQ